MHDDTKPGPGLDAAMREEDLSAPAFAWLASRGFDGYAELPIMGRKVDIVGRRGDDLCCVEMKLCFNRKVRQQAYTLQLVTSDVWCFVGRKPRDASKAADAGLGLAYFDGEKVVELVQPAAKLDARHVYRERVFRRISGRSPGGVAGRPTTLGEGPAQDCFDRVAVFRQSHPRATWRDVYFGVANHYAHHRSMQQAMGFVAYARSKRLAPATRTGPNRRDE